MMEDKNKCYPIREGSFTVERKNRENTHTEENEYEETALDIRQSKILFFSIRFFLALGIFISVIYFDKTGFTYGEHKIRDVAKWMQSRKYLELVKEEVVQRTRQVIDQH